MRRRASSFSLPAVRTVPGLPRRVRLSLALCVAKQRRGQEERSMASGTSRVSAGFLCVEQQRAARIPLAWSSGQPQPSPEPFRCQDKAKEASGARLLLMAFRVLPRRGGNMQQFFCARVVAIYVDDIRSRCVATVTRSWTFLACLEAGPAKAREPALEKLPAEV